MAASQHTQSDPSKRTLEADAKPRQAYDRLVAQFVAQLEAGTAPWVKPWTCPQVAAGRQASGLPHNAATGRPYSGVNVLFLWASAQAFGYQGNGWLTYKQAAELGGHVRKGEHGTTVVYFKTLSRLATNDEGEEVERTFRLARAYTVFNVAQCEGLPEAITKVEPEVRPVAIIEDDADQFFADTGVTVRRGGDRAFYSPALDVVTMPPREAFKTRQHDQATLAHELCHATGHERRLARTFGNRFGDHQYAAEELVAEIGAAFLCLELGIAGQLQHAEYLATWVAALKAQPSILWSAASKASEAVDWLQQSIKAAVEKSRAEPAVAAAPAMAA